MCPTELKDYSNRKLNWGWTIDDLTDDGSAMAHTVSPYGGCQTVSDWEFQFAIGSTRWTESYDDCPSESCWANNVCYWKFPKCEYVYREHNTGISLISANDLTIHSLNLKVWTVQNSVTEADSSCLRRKWLDRGVLFWGSPFWRYSSESD